MNVYKLGRGLQEFIMSFIVPTYLDLCLIFLQLIQLIMFVTNFAVPIGNRNYQEFYKISKITFMTCKVHKNWVFLLMVIKIYNLMSIATIFFIHSWFPSWIFLRSKFDQLLYCGHKTGHFYKNSQFFGHTYRILTTLEGQMADDWHCILNLSIGTINCLSPLLIEYNWRKRDKTGTRLSQNFSSEMRPGQDKFQNFVQDRESQYL